MLEKLELLNALHFSRALQTPHLYPKLKRRTLNMAQLFKRENLKGIRCICLLHIAPYLTLPVAANSR